MSNGKRNDRRFRRWDDVNSDIVVLPVTMTGGMFKCMNQDVSSFFMNAVLVTAATALESCVRRDPCGYNWNLTYPVYAEADEPYCKKGI